ncbi:MAG: DUF411 domain-containing protein [Magnetococcus sp. YQC-5]
MTWNHRKSWFAGIGLLVALAGVGTWYRSQGEQPGAVPPRVGAKATVYKSPYCGCCAGYVDFLKEQGFQVEVESVMDMDPIKRSLGVAKEMDSCHTTKIGGYVVEGHVPLNVLQRLLTEKPNIPGIALPGMPTGVPGMPGAQEKWTIYTLENPPKVYAVQE